MPSLARILATPIKGTALLELASADLTPAGIPENRRFHLVDAAGRLFSCGAFGPLVRVRSSYEPATATLTVSFPDGEVVTADANRLAGPHTTEFYLGRPVPGQFVHGSLDDAFSAYVGRPVRLVRNDVDGDGPDLRRLTLLSGASSDDLGRRYGQEDLDSRRFRANLELDGCEPYEEDTWAGRRVRVGGAIVRVFGQVPRCVATTQNPETGLKDFDTLKRIAEYRPLITEPRGVPFAMYAEVEQPGRAAVGDTVELLAD